MQHRVIEIPHKQYETVFDDRDFEDLLRRYTTDDMTDWFVERIAELKDIINEMMVYIPEDELKYYTEDL